MHRALPALIILSLPLTGCKPDPKEAPATIEELSLMLLRDFESDTLTETVSAMTPWIDNNSQSGSAFEVPNPDLSELNDMTFSSNASQDLMIGAMISVRLTGTLDDYLPGVVETDQTWSDPDHFTSWTRSIIDGSAEGFLAGEDIDTDNLVTRHEGISSDFPFNCRKDFRWIEIDGTPMVVFRSWLYEEGVSDDGLVTMVANFQMEIWATVNGNLDWYVGTWSQIDSIGTDDYKKQQMIEGMQRYVSASESHAME